MNNDIFKRTFCEKCNFAYDSHLESCPKCKEKNYHFIQNRCRNPLFFLDLLRCIAIVFAWLILMYVLPAIVSLIAQSISPGILKTADFILGLQFGVYIAGFIAFGIILWHYKSMIFGDFKKLKNIVIGVIAGILIICLSQLLSYLIYEVGQIEVNSNQTEVENVVKNSPALAFFVIVIFGPIFEEIIFRVGLMGIGMKFNEKYGKVFAYIVSILIFILVHLNFIGENINFIAEIAAVPGYFVGASLLCLAYDKGGISSSIIAHILNNLFGFIIVMVL